METEVTHLGVQYGVSILFHMHGEMMMIKSRLKRKMPRMKQMCKITWLQEDKEKETSCLSSWQFYFLPFRFPELPLDQVRKTSLGIIDIHNIKIYRLDLTVTGYLPFIPFINNLLSIFCIYFKSLLKSMFKVELEFGGQLKNSLFVRKQQQFSNNLPRPLKPWNFCNKYLSEYEIAPLAFRS